MKGAAPRRGACPKMDYREGWSIDVDVCIGPPGELVWQVEPVPWRSGAEEWDRFDAVHTGVPRDCLEDPARFLVMGLELIEPSMYLRMDPEAPGLFARALDRHVRRGAGDLK